jgi:hypothetical protein
MAIPESKIEHLARNIAIAPTVQATAPAAAVLHEAGGKRLLGEFHRKVLREAVIPAADRFVANHTPYAASAHAGLSLSNLVPKPLTLAELPALTAGAAGRLVAAGVAKATLLGSLADGLVAACVAVFRGVSGLWTPREATAHVAKEAATGAAASAAGAAAAAGFVGLVGAPAVPSVVAVSAAASIATKVGLNRLVDQAMSPEPPRPSQPSAEAPAVL